MTLLLNKKRLIEMTFFLELHALCITSFVPVPCVQQELPPVSPLFRAPSAVRPLCVPFWWAIAKEGFGVWECCEIRMASAVYNKIK